MTDRNGTPISDGIKVRVLDVNFQGQLVEGVLATVDFIENNPPKVAITTADGFEQYVRPGLLVVQKN